LLLETPGFAKEDASDIAATLSGDGEAYRRLVLRYQGIISQQMSRFSRDASVREELVHDIFVEAYMSLRSYRGTAPWLNWLRKVAVRVGYRYWRSRKSLVNEITLPENAWEHLRGTIPNPVESIAAPEMVYTLLALLTPPDRLVLTLLYVDGCTMAEAADLAGWTLIGAKVRAYRARNRLKKLIAKGAS
jgi:RNA polymerase sigma-70 factor (ECF subfamily)